MNKKNCFEKFKDKEFPKRSTRNIGRFCKMRIAIQ